MAVSLTKDQILSKAKIALMNRPNSVFISTIVLSLESHWGDYVCPDGLTVPNPTACTDGISLYLNEDFFLKLNPLEQVGLLAHEAWHVALQHVLPDRRGSRDPNIWNQAADHVINLQLLDEKFRLPKGGLHDPAYAGMSTEKVYDIIFKDKSKQDPNFQPDFVSGTPGGQSPTQQAAHQAAVTDLLVRAATQSQMAGQSVGGIGGEVLIGLNKLLYPKLPWHVILHEYLNGMNADDYTFSKGNRRFLPKFFLPSLYSEAMGTFACAIDTSGSVSDEDFVAFATEIDEAIQTMNPEKVNIVDFDTRINSVYELGAGESVSQLQFKGRGGTDMEPVFEYFTKNPPHVLIIFSDMECDEITKDPGFPVIWIKTPGYGFTPTFGKVIDFDPHH